MVKDWFIRISFAVIFTLCTVLTAQAETSRPLTVFAAASLGEALQDVLAQWPGEVRLSLGGSGAMARQIDQGAPADVVLLAHPQWMDWLDGRGRVIAATRDTPLGNALVIAGPAGAEPLALADLPTVLARLGETGRLAMGEHRSVPAGQYAQEWLQRRAMWEALRPRLAEVENVRAALALLSRGEVPLAILYASDLWAAQENAVAVWTIPDSEQPVIRYALAAVTEAGRPLAAFLGREQAIQTFRAYGFRAGDP